MSREYSLAISVSKIRELKKKKNGTISHLATKRWLSFYEKQHEKVRFFDTMYNEECVCSVLKITQKYTSLDTRIEITVEL